MWHSISDKTGRKGSLEKIEIKEKITPYSHQSGVECLVPLSDWVVQVYPALLKVGGLEFPLAVTGPEKEFTVQMDLEKDCVWVWGISKEGHFRLKLTASEYGLSLMVDRSPKGGISIGGKLLERKESILLAKGGQFSPKKACERFSLGNWKAQDWDLVRRRADFSEIAPLLFLLGQKLPKSESTLLTHTEHFFLAALSGICAPKPQDAIHQGLSPFTGEPISLIQSAYQTIRSYLIDGESILPKLPNNWDAGKVIGLQTKFGTVDLEWTKGHIRRMVLVSSDSGSIALSFTKEISSCRCNGKHLENGSSLPIEVNKKYLFERFQK